MGRSSVATDAFTGASLNANWSLITPGTAVINVDGLGHMICEHSTEGIVRWTGNSFSDNQYSLIKVISWSNLDDAFVGVVARCSADTDTNADYYEYRAQDVNTGLGTQSRPFVLQKVVNGTPTVLASGNVSCGDNSTIAIEVEGTALRGYVDGVLQHSSTDSSLTTGRPGAMNSRNGSILADDWDGGDVTASAVSITPTAGAPGLSGNAPTRVVGTLLTPATP